MRNVEAERQRHQSILKLLLELASCVVEIDNVELRKVTVIIKVKLELVKAPEYKDIKDVNRYCHPWRG
ncbi:hypothetical protein F9B85_13590 [Heliorestis acidaminivorans]|uniref:Uncharacterized protein n=1 Tax=Heliorestis acidaminivorans TaxID=553427 RepID=A0A6I0EZ46_9FIRM|nr:hypothetical protein [Heliorestis acidaminivorans]KAB2950984.1 hypothetical protein F9B85_13590 [Heliorestis acidaminivorans]